MKVLLSAYACEPGRGSEPKVGWEAAQQLGKYHEVWVVTHSRHQQAVEAWQSSHTVPSVRFIFYNLPRFTKWWDESWLGYKINYYLWQIGAYFVARKLHGQFSFDIAQHVSLVKYYNPSFIALLSIPFVWGPVGGGESAPKAFRGDFSLRAKIYEILRDVVRWAGEYDPFVNLTTRRSAVSIGTTEETANRLRALGAKRVEILGETGLSQQEIESLKTCQLPNNDPLRFISIARLIHWKGIHLGLRAFARAEISNSEYWIVGDGRERKRLQVLAEQLGVAAKVHFWGSLSRSETLQKLSECHILVHPSLHDSGGNVCLEAMAVGRPIICLNLGGPATQVSEDVGFKVPALTPEQAIGDLANAMIRLAPDSVVRHRMGEAGRRRIRELYNWDSKGRFMSQLYHEILDEKSKLSSCVLPPKQLALKN